MLEKLTTGALALVMLSACRPEWDTSNNALIAAARTGRLDAMRALIKSGADVNRRGRNNWTPLVHAIHKRQDEAARLLLDSGAGADEVVNGGATPLIASARTVEDVRRYLCPARRAAPLMNAAERPRRGRRPGRRSRAPKLPSTTR